MTESAARTTEQAAAQRGGGRRYVFVALGALYVMVAVAGFTPSYVSYAAGAREIHWFAHLHGALLGAWLCLYVAQAALAASGAVGSHRRLGLAGVALGGLVWVSMGIASVRVRLELDPPVDSFLWDVFARELVLAVSFPVFFVSAVFARRNPAAHKRLMTLAAAVLLQAAIDRLPILRTLAIQSPWFLLLYPLCLYALIAPLVAFDVANTRRVHRATLVGIGVVFAGHVTAASLAGNAAWHELAHGLFDVLRSRLEE
jgi:hypothetical protein